MGLILVTMSFLLYTGSLLFVKKVSELNPQITFYEILASRYIM
jgi:hypothetical protein